MKFTRSKVLITLLVLGLIIVYVNLLTSYVNLTKSQSTIRDQINTSVKTLSLLPSAPKDSQKRMEEAQKTYDAALSAVSSTDIDSTQVMEALIKTAAECNIKVNPAVTNQWMERTFGVTTYRILPLTLEIKGSHTAIINYVQRLEDLTQFPYLAIEDLTMVEASQSVDTLGDDEQQATLNADIIVRLAAKS